MLLFSLVANYILAKNFGQLNFKPINFAYQISNNSKKAV